MKFSIVTALQCGYLGKALKILFLWITTSVSCLKAIDHIPSLPCLVSAKLVLDKNFGLYRLKLR